MMTTAKMREKARLYESTLDWDKAALCWDAAADLYPQPGPQYGALAASDVATMRARARSCCAQLSVMASGEDFTNQQGHPMRRSIYFNTTTAAILGIDNEQNRSARIASIAASWAMACDNGQIPRDEPDALPSALVRYRAILDAAMPALSESEWALLCDVLNGSVLIAHHADIDPARTLADSVEDSGADGSGEKWGVDVAEFSATLRTLSYASQCAAIETVARFWAQAGNSMAPIGQQLVAAGAKVIAIGPKP